MGKQADPRLVAVYRDLLDYLAESGHIRTDDVNFHGTDERAARGLAELVRPLAEIEAEKDALLAATFPSDYSGMILSKHNLAWGLCPHHLLPVIYRVSLAYLPKERVLGISKLSRLAKIMAKTPRLQEDLTSALAEVLWRDLDSLGSAVYVEGLHLCMASRGVEVHDARIVTSELRGAFRERQATRMEFLDLVRTSAAHLV